MRRKCFIMALVSFVLALVIYAVAYFMYHYLGPDGNLGTVFYEAPAKPFVTLYVGIWGVMHQFAAVVCLLVGLIFFPKDKK